MTADEARSYHALQVRAFAEAGADLVTAITMTNTDEAIGVVAAAQAAGLAGRDLVHGGDRRCRSPRASALGRCHRRRGRRHRRLPGVLHGQLRPPDALRPRARSGGALDRADQGHPGQRVAALARRAGRGRGARRRRRRASWPSSTGRCAVRHPGHRGGGWLLRHEPRARRAGRHARASAGERCPSGGTPPSSPGRGALDGLVRPTQGSRPLDGQSSSCTVGARPSGAAPAPSS